MFYDRQIKYLDYLENKERIRGVGFAKIEVRDNVCELHIQVNGMHVTDNFVRKLMLVGEEEEAVLCEITFEKGRGSVDFQKLDSRNLVGSGIAYTQLYGIRIPIAAGKEIYCVIRERGEGKLSVDTVQHAQIQTKQIESEQRQAAEVRQPVERTVQAAKEEQIQEREVREREAQEEKRQAREAQEKELISRKKQEREAQEKEAREREEQEREEQEREVREIQEREAQEREIQENRQQLQSQLQQNDDQRGGGMQTRGNKLQSEADLQPEDRQQQASSQAVNVLITSKGIDSEDISVSTQDDVIAQNIEEFVKKALQANTQETDGQKLNSEKFEREVESQESQTVSRRIKVENQPSASKGLQENKWKQLAAIYPHIRPFRDDRDYLSISPRDFVILTEKYYNMANNSFLLHGYYNYKHLILSRLEKRGNITYYVGVPGNFYEKEKQVALLFGFESFECAEEPARAGDYGYYMMKVEL